MTVVTSTKELLFSPLSVFSARFHNKTTKWISMKRGEKRGRGAKEESIIVDLDQGAYPESHFRSLAL